MNEFKRSRKWRLVRFEVKKRANFRCEIIGCERAEPELAAIGLYLVVHHMLPVHLFPDFAFDKKYLVSCCNLCHDGIHEGRNYSLVSRRFIDGDLFPEELIETLESERKTRQFMFDMGFWDDNHERRVRAVDSAKRRLFAFAYDRDARLEAANERAEQIRQVVKNLGVLEDEYSERGTIDCNDGPDRNAVSKTADPNRRRPA